MITIQSAMLVALGVLSVGFVVLLLMPFYRRRAERLAVAEVKRLLPMSEAEIRADKDRLRAEYAIRIHQLEARVEDASLQAARQKIELNRRDGMISGLEGEIATLRGTMDEHENARRVLEQTITDRLPKVEQRLAQARDLLNERNQEIERLTRNADHTARALEESRQINTQQRDQLLRTSATLASRAARNRDQLVDPRFDGEVALRSEIEALRARGREQAEMITRLQELLARGDGKPSDVRPSDGQDAEASDGPKDREVADLRARLSETEMSLRAAQSVAEADKADKAGPRKAGGEMRALKKRNDLLATEVARLKAALQIYEDANRHDTSVKDSKVAMKARLGALEAEIARHTETIETLRAEVAAANERLARQASHYRDELRRLGAGTLPTPAEPRSGSLDEPSNRRASLAERMGAPRPVSLKAVGGAGKTLDDPRAAGYLKALSGRGSGEGASFTDGTVSLAEIAPAAEASSQHDAEVPSEVAATAEAGVENHNAADSEDGTPRRRSGLIDRISSASKTST